MINSASRRNDIYETRDANMEFAVTSLKTYRIFLHSLEDLIVRTFRRLAISRRHFFCRVR